MPVKVSFMRRGFPVGFNVEGAGPCRVCETIALGATTTAAALDGEIAVLVSTEANTVMYAHGTTPNASATAESGTTTTAGVGLPAGVMVPVLVRPGDRISVAAFA